MHILLSGRPLSGVLGVRWLSEAIRTRLSKAQNADRSEARTTVDADELHVTVDDEGIVRCPSVEQGCAVMMDKETLEKLLTEVYSLAFADLELERKTRQ